MIESTKRETRFLVRGRGLILWIAGTLGVLGCVAAERPLTQEQDAEFRAAIDAAVPEAESIAGDTAALLARVQPFGSLDLILLRETDADRASLLRSTFLGVVGSAAGIDPGPFANRWHCGEPCAMARRDTLMARLAAARTVVAQLRAVPSLEVVAAWPGGGYRAGSLTFDGRTFRVHSASPKLGLLPWQNRPVSGDAAPAFSNLHTSRAAVETIVAGLRAGGFAVAARDKKGSVRVVLAGAIGDNEAGLLFLAPDDAMATHRDAKLLDGRRYVHLEEVASGVCFYITT